MSSYLIAFNCDYLLLVSYHFGLLNALSHLFWIWDAFLSTWSASFLAYFYSNCQKLKDSICPPFLSSYLFVNCWCEQILLLLHQHFPFERTFTSFLAIDSQTFLINYKHNRQAGDSFLFTILWCFPILFLSIFAKKLHSEILTERKI